jgi:hypothetical protein
MRIATFVVLVLALSKQVAWAQLEPSCVENSPERRGEIGCSLVENKALPAGLRGPLIWHIDRFATEDAATAAVGPTSVAFGAHGVAWLMTIESAATNHHGGQHVAAAAMPALPVGDRAQPASSVGGDRLRRFAAADDEDGRECYADVDVVQIETAPPCQSSATHLKPTTRSPEIAYRSERLVPLTGASRRRVTSR